MIRGHAHADFGICLESAGGSEEFDVWGFESAQVEEVSDM
jgi:hypothetical protein